MMQSTHGSYLTTTDITGLFYDEPELWQMKAAMLRLIQLELCHPLHQDISEVVIPNEHADLLPMYRDIYEKAFAWQIGKLVREPVEDMYKTILNRRVAHSNEARSIGMVVSSFRQ